MKHLYLVVVYSILLVIVVCCVSKQTKQERILDNAKQHNVGK